MIICQNCGTTNNERLTRICRNCGALLPVPSKTHREKVQKSTTEKKKKQKTTNKIKAKPVKTEKNIVDDFVLEEIPKESEIKEEIGELQEIPPTSKEEFAVSKRSQDKSTILQEIPAQPFRGSIIDTRKGTEEQITIPTPPSRSENAISDAFTALKTSILEEQKQVQEVPLTPIPSESIEKKQSMLKQKQLEKDMTDVLSFLSKKISVKKLDLPKPEKRIKEEPKKEIPPSSMNEILKRLMTLDLNIEASAIIKTDGTILASATSNRISDSLFATIGMNLSMIGSDIIEGLSAGSLKSISLKATNGVLDLAPIDKKNPSVKDMYLILFSHSKVKSGIISFAINIVKKQIKEYLGLNIK